MQEIKTEEYRVEHDPESSTIYFRGELSLGGPAEYAPIAQMLEQVADQLPPTIVLNLKDLEFLNSSGISMISKFVISLRKKQTIQVVVIGAQAIPWQGKSLQNLQKLLPGLKLELV